MSRVALYFRIYLSEIKGLSILKGVIACVLGMMQDICFFMEYGNSGKKEGYGYDKKNLQRIWLYRHTACTSGSCLR